MGRDARIVPKFCVSETVPQHVTLCAQRSKKFFSGGVFYRFNCCTDVAVCRVGIPNAIHHIADYRQLTTDYYNEAIEEDS